MIGRTRRYVHCCYYHLLRFSREEQAIVNDMVPLRLLESFVCSNHPPQTITMAQDDVMATSVHRVMCIACLLFQVAAESDLFGMEGVKMTATASGTSTGRRWQMAAMLAFSVIKLYKCFVGDLW